MLDYLEKHENAKCMPNVTSVKFASETWRVNTGLTFNFRSLRSLRSLNVISIKFFWRVSIATIAEIEPGSIPAIVIVAIAGIAQIAEVWFPYNRWDRWANFSAILAISAIPAIIWKPGLNAKQFWQLRRLSQTNCSTTFYLCKVVRCSPPPRPGNRR